MAKSLKALRDADSLEPAELTEHKEKILAQGTGVLDDLFSLLSSPEGRPHATELLNANLSEANLGEFIAALKSDSTQTVAGATEVLSESRGYDAHRMLDELVKPKSNRGAIDTIITSRHKDLQASRVVQILDNAPNECRPIILRWLENYGDASILEALEAMYTVEDTWLAVQAIRVTRGVLKRMDSPIPLSTREALVFQLQADTPTLRRQVVETLGAANVTEAVPELCEALRDGDLKVHTAAIDALIDMNDPSAVLHLIDVLKDESEFARRGAVEVLNAVATPDAIQDLVRALSDQDWWVRVRAADALSALGGDRVADAILPLLSTEDLFIRRYAVEIFNTVTDPRAVEPLISSLNDPDWWVRERSIDALAKTQDARAVTPLIALMSRDHEAAPHCARALGTLGDPLAIEPLADLARTGEGETSAAAFEAMDALQNGNLSPDDLRLLQGLMRTSRLQRKQAPMGERGPATDPEHGRSDAPKPAGPVARDSIAASASNLESEVADLSQSMAEDLPRPTTELDKPDVTRELQRAEAAPSISTPPGDAPEESKAAAPINSFNPSPGSVILDRFEVVKKIGSGGFGAVFLVRDVDVSENIILKILNRQISTDDSMIKRFIQELKLTRRITHTNVIRLYDFLKLEQSAYAISMEYFPGRDLSRLLTDEKLLNVERGVFVMDQFCEGLCAAHSEGIIHRDVKPANVLINGDDEIKIVDFGLASMTHDAGSRLTKSGILIGSPHYMSPEQITGGEIDIRTDIYSMGIMMFEMFVGQVPFDGESAVSLIYKHLQEAAPRISEHVADFPPELDDLVFECMAKEPDERPADSGEVLARIRALTT